MGSRNFQAAVMLALVLLAVVTLSSWCSPVGVAQAFSPTSTISSLSERRAGGATSTTRTPTQLNLKEEDMEENSQEGERGVGGGDAYYLLWSPNAWKKIVSTTVALILIPRGLARMGFLGASASCHSNRGSSTAATVASLLWSNAALPLAASACCLLQLGLNALAVGCAGWNKVLGPMRPYFLALLLVTSLQPPLPRSTTLVGRATIALLPEMLHWYNTHVPQRRITPPTSTTMEDESGRAVMPPSQLEQVTLEIPSMGCVACINSINWALSRVPGVVSAKSQLHSLGMKGGSATIVVAMENNNNNPEEGPSSSSSSSSSSFVYEHLTEAVAKAGFEGAIVESIRKHRG